MSEVSRLRWLCRRGMKELDVVLTRYLDNRYPEADESVKEVFRRLLDMPDPDLYALLLKHKLSPDADIQKLVESIRDLALAHRS